MLLAATLTAAGAAAAAGYGLTAPKRYDATAKLLVTPVAASDTAFTGLGVFRDAGERRTAAQSAAVLVRTPEVADAVRLQLALRRSDSSLLDDLHAHVVGGSNVVDVTAEDASAVSAAQLANAFVDAFIADRTASFLSQLSSAIRRDVQLLASGSAGSQAVEVARQLAVLRAFQGQPDPTLRRASTAVAPTSAAWPNLAILVLGGAGAGLAVAAVISLVLVLLRPRRREYDRLVTSRPSEPAVDALVDRLEQRLAARESAFAARERDLQRKIDELRATSPDDRERKLAAREQELDERERQLGERVAVVTRRELALARTAARRASAAEENGGFNLSTLERLVAEGGSTHPERIAEWESYLFFLRDYAAPDGALPHTFDALVEETFRPLL